MRHEKIIIQTKQTEAELTLYLLDNYPIMDMDRIRPTVLVCPGGGYSFLSERETEAIAIQMNAMGFHAAVLRYHVAPARFPVALAEAACSVAHLRAHAAEYGVDPEKIIVAGFSAGGHLAASLGVFWDKEWLTEHTGCAPEEIRPNGLVLSYPVITSGEHAHRGSFNSLLGEGATEEQLEFVSLEKQVTASTPPTFIWHTVGDQLVPVENTMLFAAALQRAGVKFEMHVYPQGEHGLALSTEETASVSNEKYSAAHRVRPECAAWVGMAGRFVKEEV
ncbi:MAG: alpha/beta hydrolase [Lachnospiraceae bacterium]|nr:alpha/beta hydrolase [Lachnospiraceae bacterium]